MNNELTLEHAALPIKSAKLAFFQITMLMIGVSLLVDAVNGFFLSGMGFDPKLSASFKLLMLLLVLYQIGSYSIKTLAIIFTTLMVMLIGPIITFFDTTDVAGFVDDFTSGLKLLTGLIVFIYIYFVANKWPEKTNQYARYCIIFSFSILLINIVLGVLGFGFSSYGNLGNDSDEAIGIKGFFYAGNEVSGLFIVLSTAVLHMFWQQRRAWFLFAALVVIATGLLIATKAAMLAGVLVTFLVPLVNERNRMLNVTWLKVKLSFPLIVLLISMFFILIPLLDTTGLLNRFIWFYEKKGILGIILSGRDEFVIEALTVFMQNASWSDIIFGYSKTGLTLFTKGSMEIDPIDMYFWHGISGIVLFLVYISTFLFLAYSVAKHKCSYWAPCVLIINIILFGVSMIAGHILTSGMLAPLFGLINGVVFIDLINKNKAQQQSVTA